MRVLFRNTQTLIDFLDNDNIKHELVRINNIIKKHKFKCYVTNFCTLVENCYSNKLILTPALKENILNHYKLNDPYRTYSIMTAMYMNLENLDGTGVRHISIFDSKFQIDEENKCDIDNIYFMEKIEEIFKYPIPKIILCLYYIINKPELSSSIQNIFAEKKE